MSKQKQSLVSTPEGLLALGSATIALGTAVYAKKAASKNNKKTATLAGDLKILSEQVISISQEQKKLAKKSTRYHNTEFEERLNKLEDDMAEIKVSLETLIDHVKVDRADIKKRISKKPKKIPKKQLSEDEQSIEEIELPSVMKRKSRSVSLEESANEDSKELEALM